MDSNKLIDEKSAKTPQQRTACQQITKLYMGIRIELIIFFHMFGLCLMSYTDTSLIMQRVCRIEKNYSQNICENFKTDSQYRNQKISIQQATDNWLLGISILNSLPCVFISMVVGPWSDRYGRKLPLLISMAGVGFRAVSMLLVTFNETWPPYAIFLSNVPAALTGSFLPFLMMVSFLTDITDESERTMKFIFVEAFVMLGSPSGTLVSGYVFERFGFYPVYLLATVTLTTGIVLGMVILKESRGIGNVDSWAVRISYLFSIKNFKRSVRVCFRRRDGYKRFAILSLSISVLCYIFYTGIQDMTFLYTELIFGWNQWRFSIFQSATNFAMLFLSLCATPVLGYLFSASDPTLGILSYISCIASTITMGLATTTGIFYFGGFLNFMEALIPPLVRSCLSKLTTTEETGQVFAFTLSLEAAMPLISSLCYTQIYNVTVGVFPSFVFFLAGFSCLWPLVVFIGLKLYNDRETFSVNGGLKAPHE